MKRPSFQFYPGDWQSNSNLRRCTHTEKGVWLDVLCLLHDQPEYGVLRWNLKEIAQAIGAKVAEVRALVAKGVLKGADDQLTEPHTYTPRSGRVDGETVVLIGEQAGPLWYSSRMVRDEYVRTHRGESTRFSASPKPSPKGGIGARVGEGQSDGSSSSSSSSSSINTNTKTTTSYEVVSKKPPKAPQCERPEDVSESVWADFVAHRKAKKAAISATAMKGIQREAGKAGVTLESALEMMCQRGWTGFSASWVGVTGPTGKPLNQQEALEGSNLEVARRWAEKMAEKERTDD